MDTMNSTIEERNKAIIKKVLFEGDNHNVAILEEVCSHDYKMYFPSTAEPLSLKEHIALWTAFNIAFPDLKHTVHESVAEGDFVTQRETLSGTHKGSFQGIPPTGKKIEMSAICMWRFSKGKIVEYWADGDMLGLMHQLGMELQSKTDHTIDQKEEAKKIMESPKERLKELVGTWKVIESSYSDPPEGTVTVILVSDGNSIFSTWKHGRDETYYEANALWGYSETTKQIRVFEVNTLGVAETHVGYFDDSGTLILVLRNPNTNSIMEKRSMTWAGETWKMTALFIVDGKEVNHHLSLVRQKS